MSKYSFVVFIGNSDRMRKNLRSKKWLNNPIIGKEHRIPSIMEKIKKSVNPKEITI